MRHLDIAYICFAGHSHLDWGGTLETLKELRNRGNNVIVLSGESIRSYVKEHGLSFQNIGLSSFRPRIESEAIEDTLAYHQFHNFFDVESISNTFQKGMSYLNEQNIDVILSDPLCKTGPLMSMRTGIPYVVMGPYNYTPDVKVSEDNVKALQQFLERFEEVTRKLGVVEGHKLPLVQNSPWLNIVFSTPNFDQELLEPNITHVGSDILLKDETFPISDRIKVFYSSGTIFWDAKQVEAVSNLAKKYPLELYFTKAKIIPHVQKKDNVKVYDFCDDKKIIPNMNLLITQGGLGTVTTGIRSGVPMMILPLFWYNMPQAIKVSRYGNGLSLNSLEEQIAKIDETFEKITANKIYLERAKAVQKEFTSYGGSKKAADLICGLICDQ